MTRLPMRSVAGSYGISAEGVACGVVDDAGVVLTDAALLDRLVATGAVVVRRGPVESLDFASWRRGLRQAARARGRRISVNRLDESVAVVSDPDFVVDREQMRATVEAIPVPPGVERPAPTPGGRRPARRLRLVEDGRVE